MIYSSILWNAGGTHYAQVEYDPPREQPRIYAEGSCNQICDALKQSWIPEREVYKYIRAYPKNPHSSPHIVKT